LNKLKQIRQQQGLSGQGLAVKAKLSTATVTAIEKWDYVPSHPTQEKIANALRVQVCDIWTQVPAESGRTQTQGGEADAKA